MHRLATQIPIPYVLYAIGVENTVENRLSLLPHWTVTGSTELFDALNAVYMEDRVSIFDLNGQVPTKWEILRMKYGDNRDVLKAAGIDHVLFDEDSGIIVLQGKMHNLEIAQSVFGKNEHFVFEEHILL
jgi:hypothetical protein